MKQKVEYENQKPVVKIENNRVIKRYKNATIEYNVNKILQEYTDESWGIPEIVNNSSNQITMKICDGVPIRWRRVKIEYLFKKMEETGSLLARLHCIKDARMDKVIKQQNVALHDYVLNKFSDYLNNFGGIFLNTDYKNKIKIGFLDSIKKINLHSNYGFVHGDFCYQNLLFGKKSNYVIDFENSHIGYQVDDLSRFSSKIILLGIEIPNLPVDILEKKFLKSYSSIIPFDHLTYEHLKFAYLLNIKKPLEISNFNPLAVLNKSNNRRRYKKLINFRYCKIYRKISNSSSIS
jgi:tRNA A-37 threonylcarbamoyl transferase component Bud32